VYIKNEFPEYFRNGTIKKQSQYIKVDLEHIMDTLKPGQVYEIKDAYIGKDKKLFTRLIMYRLKEKQLRERMKKQVYTESKKGITYSEKSKRLAGMNLHIRQFIYNKYHLCFCRIYPFLKNLRSYLKTLSQQKELNYRY
jgi:hypothetical protein